jgi:hypothetical protein
MKPYKHKTFGERVEEVIPIVIVPAVLPHVETAVEDYLTENPPTGGLNQQQIMRLK